LPVIERVSAEDALQRVQSAVGSKASSASLVHGHVDITVAPADLVEVMTALRDADGLRCRFFTFLSAIDRTEFGGPESETKGGLEVLVHVYSPDHVIHVNVHVPVDLESPVCPTLTDVFDGAHWQERETHEMFGIEFDGHPRLVPLYLSEDFEGHPLRRDFKLPSRVIKDWPGAKDPEEAAGGGR
jgi:NADH-quinone oxidoreductase subunit C